MDNTKKNGFNPGRAIYRAADRKWDIIDLIFMIVIFAICYFCFVHGDILVTGNRSFLMQTNPLDFYDRCLEWTNDLGANYLPSTFGLFAIWNLPLRLLGRVPAEILTNPLGNMLWYKLLPMLFLIASSFLMEKICLQMNMGKLKSRMARYIFLVSPLTLFCQVIFGQYDIFTIFFILLGIYFCLKKERKKFILFFAIAITFKYQAILYFIVILLLREKRILRIILDVILVAIPTAIEILIYYPSAAFRASVLNFGALSYVDTGVDLGGFKPLNLFLLVLIALVVWAYIKRPEDEADEIKWTIFMLNGISFAFFGFVYFHPQWLLLCVPFMVMAILYSSHSKILLILQNVLIVAFYVLIVNSWPVNTDQQMFAYGVLKSRVPAGWALKMKDILAYDNMVYLFTAIFAVLFVYVWLSHPRYALKDPEVIQKDTMVNVRIAFAVAFLAWCVPAFICLKAAVDGKYQMIEDKVSEDAVLTPLALTEDNRYRQELPGSADEIYSMQLYFGNYGHANDVNLTVSFVDRETEETVYEKNVEMYSIMADGWVEILDEPVELNYEDEYYLDIRGAEGYENCVAVFEGNAFDESRELEMNGIEQAGYLLMQVKARNY